SSTTRSSRSRSGTWFASHPARGAATRAGRRASRYSSSVRRTSARIRATTWKVSARGGLTSARWDEVRGSEEDLLARLAARVPRSRLGARRRLRRSVRGRQGAPLLLVLFLRRLVVEQRLRRVHVPERRMRRHETGGLLQPVALGEHRAERLD